MSVETTTELFEFHQFVGQKLATQDRSLTPEEVLDMWREDRPTPEETEATIAAVKKALDEMRAGDQGTPIEEFHARFRAEHQIP